MHMLPPLRPAVLHLPGRQRSDILTELGQLVGRQHVVHDANARGPHSCCCRAIGERSCRQDGQASGQGSRRLERLARLASPVQPDRHRRRGRTHGKAERVARCARHRATHASTASGAERGPYRYNQSAHSQADTLPVDHPAPRLHPPRAASPLPACSTLTQELRNDPPPQHGTCPPARLCSPPPGCCAPLTWGCPVITPPRRPTPPARPSSLLERALDRDLAPVVQAGLAVDHDALVHLGEGEAEGWG